MARTIQHDSIVGGNTCTAFQHLVLTGCTKIPECRHQRSLRRWRLFSVQGPHFCNLCRPARARGESDLMSGWGSLQHRQLTNVIPVPADRIHPAIKPFTQGNPNKSCIAVGKEFMTGAVSKVANVATERCVNKPTFKNTRSI